jgi:hypothetical protein
MAVRAAKIIGRFYFSERFRRGRHRICLRFHFRRRVPRHGRPQQAPCDRANARNHNRNQRPEKPFAWLFVSCCTAGCVWNEGIPLKRFSQSNYDAILYEFPVKIETRSQAFMERITPVAA